MRQTLFRIPNELFGQPVFGFGLLLALWAVVSLVLMARLVRRQGFNADTLTYIPLLLVVGVVIAFLLPKLLDQGGLPIRGYGVMLLVAILAGVALAAYRAWKIGLDPEIIFSMAFWLFLGGIGGARLFYIIQYSDRFSSPWDIFNVAQGGLVVYGSMIGGGAMFLLFVRKNKLPAMALADLIAPSLVLGLALGRIGCLLNGCCFGSVCEAPALGHQWAVTFPWGSPPHVRQMQLQQNDAKELGIELPEDIKDEAVIVHIRPNSPADRAGLKKGNKIIAINGKGIPDAPGKALTVGQFQSLIMTPARTAKIMIAEGPTEKTVILPRSNPVHPTQIYSAINALLICLILLAYDPYRLRDGAVVALFLTIYSITRFLLEIIRTDVRPFLETGMTISQNLSILLLALAIGLWIYVVRRPARLAFVIQGKHGE